MGFIVSIINLSAAMNLNDAFYRYPVAMLVIEFTGKYWDLMRCDKQKYAFCIRNQAWIRKNNARNFFDAKNNRDFKISAEGAIICKEKFSIKLKAFPILIKHRKCDFAFSNFKKNKITFLPSNRDYQEKCVFWYDCERDEKKQIYELKKKPTKVLMENGDFSNNDEYLYKDFNVETIPMDEFLQNIKEKQIKSQK